MLLSGDISARLITTTVLDDFERADATTGYVGNTANIGTETTSPIEGTTSLLSTSNFGKVARGDSLAESTRGNEYAIRIRTIPGQETYFGVGSQSRASGGALDDNLYECWIDEPSDEIYLGKVDTAGGSGFSRLGTTPQVINGGTTYVLALEYGPTGQANNLVYKLYDGDPYTGGGSELARVTATDDTFTGGYWMIYTGDGSGFVFDYVTETPL